MSLAFCFSRNKHDAGIPTSSYDRHKKRKEMANHVFAFFYVFFLRLRGLRFARLKADPKNPPPINSIDAKHSTFVINLVAYI